MSYVNILKKCIAVAEERELEYGEVEENMKKTARILGWGNAEQIPFMFVANKLARNEHQFKEDNIIDAINYLAIYLHLHAQRSKVCPKDKSTPPSGSKD